MKPLSQARLEQEDFFKLSSLEAQFICLAEKLTQGQNVMREANNTPLAQRVYDGSGPGIAFIPDLDQKLALEVRALFRLAPNTPTLGKISKGVVEGIVVPNEPDEVVRTVRRQANSPELQQQKRTMGRNAAVQKSAEKQKTQGQQQGQGQSNKKQGRGRPPGQSNKSKPAPATTEEVVDAQVVDAPAANDGQIAVATPTNATNKRGRKPGRKGA